MIDQYFISLFVAIGGAFAGMVLPYLIKCREDPETTFAWSYFYTLIFTAALSAIALIPAEIHTSPQYYVSLFFGAFGIQTAMSKAKKKK